MKRAIAVLGWCLLLAPMAHANTAELIPGKATLSEQAWLELPTSPDTADDESFEVDLKLDYLWDGGALPFVYGSGALALGIRLFVSPRSSPGLFPPDEGGAQVADDTVPEVALGLAALGGLGLIAGIPNVGRWHHAKGYAEAVLTTIALTEIAKNLAGRHRPTYHVGSTDLDLRRSFFSGHSSVTAVTTVYLGLYLHRHVLPQLHGPYATVVRVASYGALAAAFIGVPVSRVKDNRHHLSDVTAGAFVGSAVALSFYAFQESRFLRSEEDFYVDKRRRMLLVPDLQNRGISFVTQW